MIRLFATLMLVSTLAGARVPKRLREGQKLYEEHCVACHAMDGSGGRGADLRGKFKYGEDSKTVFRAIKYGIPGTLMPPIELPDAKIRQLVDYVLYLHKKSGRPEQNPLRYTATVIMNHMGDNSFEEAEAVLHASGSEAEFEFLTRRFREEKKYPQLFEARLMQKRHELGLPLIHNDATADWPQEKRRAYDQTFIEAAREAGNLYLADGDIPRAWSYFRAIGEPAPVAAAIEKLEPREEIDPIIEIAFHEQVNPRKGLELILANYGMCRAITFFEQYPDRKTRDAAIRVLVRGLHRELLENLKRAISEAEGQAPETGSVTELIEGRDWLFGQYSSYVDASHLVSVLQCALELSDRETLLLALELAEYGRRLSPEFHFHVDPPFQNVYVDAAIYLRGLLGEDADTAVAHFRNKVAESGSEVGTAPPQVLVTLLVRLERYGEAIEVSLEHLRDLEPSQLVCPSVYQLCQQAGDYQRLMELAREKGDLLSFAAGAVQNRRNH